MADMLYCILRYNVGFYDYHIFGFAHIHGAKARSTFFTMQDNWRLTRMVNSPEDRPYFENKLLFCRTFAPYLGRSFLDLNEAGEDALADFLRHHPVVFLKEPESFGGLGVKRFDSAGTDLNDREAVKRLRENWVQNGLLLVEEALQQHPEMSALYPYSLNTLRVCTLTDDKGDVHVLYIFVRTGRHGSFVDNTTSGGLNALICDDGVIRRPAMSDKTGMYFDMHPDTCTPFINFRVPYFDEAVALCKKAAKVRPNMRYVGWDVGITPTGPVLVEGNNLPAYDGQIYHQQENPGIGLPPPSSAPSFRVLVYIILKPYAKTRIAAGNSVCNAGLLFSVRSARLALKNRRRIAVHSSHSNPRYNSGLKAFLSDVTATAVPHAPIASSSVPNTMRSTRAFTVAPAHMGHGSSVTYSVQPVNRQEPSTFAACSIASSSAWPSTL